MLRSYLHDRLGSFFCCVERPAGTFISRACTCRQLAESTGQDATTATVPSVTSAELRIAFECMSHDSKCGLVTVGDLTWAHALSCFQQQLSRFGSGDKIVPAEFVAAFCAFRDSCALECAEEVMADKGRTQIAHTLNTLASDCPAAAAVSRDLVTAGKALSDLRAEDIEAAGLSAPAALSASRLCELVGDSTNVPLLSAFAPRGDVATWAWAEEVAQ